MLYVRMLPGLRARAHLSHNLTGVLVYILYSADSFLWVSLIVFPSLKVMADGDDKLKNQYTRKNPQTHFEEIASTLPDRGSEGQP